MPSASPAITRFAPSPTGHLHIGGARTALFCWAYARKTGGRFMIRIEDTDQARSSEASARGILQDLAWLAISWDDGPTLKVNNTTLGANSRPVGPFFQAQRIAIYNAYIEHLMAIGRAYPAFETPAELEARRKALVAQKLTYKYQRPADVQLGVAPIERIARAKAGETHVVRFAMPDEPLHVQDEVLGEVKYAAGEMDDFVIRKADGFPTYHFAVVIDDELMGVTHILRGQEHLNNTPRHVALQNALTILDLTTTPPRDTKTRFRTPLYAHMPLIFNMDGGKMSKRDKDKAARAFCKQAGITALDHPKLSGLKIADPAFPALFPDWLKDSQKQLPADILTALADHLHLQLPEVEVEDFKQAGYLPEVICNFIALLGWSPGGDVEKFDMKYLADHFTLDRIGKTNARFDRVKLLSFNTDAITTLPAEQFASRFRAWAEEYAPDALRAFTPEQFAMLAQAVQPRSKTFRDAIDRAAFAVTPDDQLVYDPKALAKSVRAGEPAGVSILPDIRDLLGALPVFDAPSIQQALNAYAAGKAISLGNLAPPIRVAATGSAVSPPIELTLAILGKDRVLRRIARCLDLAAQPVG